MNTPKMFLYTVACSELWLYMLGSRFCVSVWRTIQSVPKLKKSSPTTRRTSREDLLRIQYVHLSKAKTYGKHGNPLGCTCKSKRCKGVGCGWQGIYRFLEHVFGRQYGPRPPGNCGSRSRSNGGWSCCESALPQPLLRQTREAIARGKSWVIRVEHLE